MSNVIVFGATGAVGGAAAIEASERGAKVWLAMRDTSKKLKAISEEQEKKGAFTRIQADLTDTASVTKAIEKSGAKSAFIYGVWESKDHMRSTVKALKDAGVTWIVFLSSYTVQGDKRKIVSGDAIPYMHAQVEIAIEEVGVPFAAMRPGYFASNEVRSVGMLKKGFYIHPHPDVEYDHIDPMNIGQVAGACLVEPKDIKPSEPQVIYIMGPRLVTVKDTMNILGKVLGKDHIEMKVVTSAEWLEANSKYIPEHIARYLSKSVDESHENPEPHRKLHREVTGNVYKYSRKRPTEFADYVEAHKDDFNMA